MSSPSPKVSPPTCEWHIEAKGYAVCGEPAVYWHKTAKMCFCREHAVNHPHWKLGRFADIRNRPRVRARKVCINVAPANGPDEHLYVCVLPKYHRGPHQAKHEGRDVHWSYGRHQECHITISDPKPVFDPKAIYYCWNCTTKLDNVRQETDGTIVGTCWRCGKDGVSAE